ncbi:MAG: twin-arginine translocase subunit TatC [Desulfobacteraceae bacterium]|jgi:sec-independent protein translocase protein TatC
MTDRDDEEKIPFTAHLEELRTRLIRCSIAVLIGTGVAYGYKEKLFDILTLPLIKALPPNGKLIYTGLPEAFFTYLKVAFITGLLAASPVIIYQFWMFVAPGLYKKERMFLIPIIILSFFFFAGGSLFGYYIVLPVGYKFFVGFSSDTIQAMPSMKEYLGLTSKMLLAFGLVFELPIVLTGMAALGITTADFLKKNRKYAIVLAFIIGAILTPSPDVVSQVLMAGPLIVLYEISIIGARIFGRKPMADSEDEQEAKGDDAEEEKSLKKVDPE